MQREFAQRPQRFFAFFAHHSAIFAVKHCGLGNLKIIHMYIIREIFHLQFGKYKEARALLDEAMKKNMLLHPPGTRILTDFTGEGYRMIIELPYLTLAEYERDLKKELGGQGWNEWYERFKSHVERSQREILKQVM